MIPERSKRATPSGPTSVPCASPIGFPSSCAVPAAKSTCKNLQDDRPWRASIGLQQ
jgi:hypothetical protein